MAALAHDGRVATYDSPWVAAILLGAAAELRRVVGGPTEPEVELPLWLCLERTVDPHGFWPFASELRRLLPPHAPTTLAALLALLERPLHGSSGVEATFTTLLGHLDSTGILPVWLVDSASLQGPPANPDWVTQSQLILLARRLGKPLLALSERVIRVFEQQGVAGSGISSPFLFLNALKGFLAAGGGGDRAEELRQRLYWELAWRREQALASPLDAALALQAHLDLAPANPSPLQAQDARDLAIRLLELQSDVGLWGAAPIFRDEVGTLYGSIQVTTAHAVLALTRYLADFERFSPPLAAASQTSQTERIFRNAPAVVRAADFKVRPGTMEDHLLVYAERLKPRLLSPDAFDSLREVSRHLPGCLTSGFGLECRLASKKQWADLLFCITPKEDGFAVLAGDSRGASLSPELLASPEWERICDFCRAWNEPQSPLNQAVADFWLEFDVDGAPAAPPIPSIFFCLGESVRLPHEAGPAEAVRRQLSEVIRLGMEILWGKKLDPALLANLKTCIDATPEGAHVFAIGAMLSRRTDALRFCIKDLPWGHHLSYLRAVGWPGDQARVAACLQDIDGLVDRAHLDIDIGSQILPTVGLECSFAGHRQPAEEERWHIFFDRLVSSGCCTLELRDFFLGWPGRFRTFERLGEDYLVESFFNQLLGHIKLGIAPGKPLEAKGYLGVWRVLERRHETPSPGELAMNGAR